MPIERIGSGSCAVAPRCAVKSYHPRSSDICGRSTGSVTGSLMRASSRNAGDSSHTVCPTTKDQQQTPAHPSPSHRITVNDAFVALWKNRGSRPCRAVAALTVLPTFFTGTHTGSRSYQQNS